MNTKKQENTHNRYIQIRLTQEEYDAIEHANKNRERNEGEQKMHFRCSSQADKFLAISFHSSGQYAPRKSSSE